MSILIKNERLWDLLQADENDQLDFKSAQLLTEPDGENRYEIAKHLVGFANHRGGRIVFGVNDDGEPEGIDLVEEKCLGTLSEILDSRCSPTPDISPVLYSDKREDLSEGTVLVVNVTEKTNAPPCAVIERSNGKIRKREYRIRSGESTRLVSDGELLALFTETPELEMETTSRISYVHSREIEPVDISPAPGYFLDMDRFYELLWDDRTDVLEQLTEEEDETTHIRYHSLFMMATTFSLLETLYTMNRESVRERVAENSDEMTIQDNHQFEVATADDISVHVDTNKELYDRIPFGITEYLLDSAEHSFIPDQDDFGFLIPANADIETLEDFKGIRISLEDSFNLEIEVIWFSSGVGLPQDHPESGRDLVGFPTNPDRSKWSHNATISISAEFNYPQQDYHEYLTCKQYCEEVSKLIIQSHDWGNFIDQFPNKKIYQIENKVDDLDQKLSEFLENQGK